MDIAALSIAIANQQKHSDAGIAMMNNVKKVMEQQGSQLVEMLEQSASKAPHPSLGKAVDVKI